MKDTEFKYFKALSDIFLNSISKKNFGITETISRFYYGAFKKVRDNSQNQPVVYPNDYYELVYKTIEELAVQSHSKNAAIEYRTSGSIWLLGEMATTEISEQTYSWIWRNLLLAIKYEQDDMVLYHWQTAHQYITYSLRHLQPEYVWVSGKSILKNAQEIEKRTSQRKRFLEFHYALGGLLVYKQRYSALKRAFDYTTSIPPKYELLPESMYEIFLSYNEIHDPYDTSIPYISHKYPFPDLSGLNADAVIKKWISSYMALLFLRQYTIVPYLIFMKPLEQPRIPKTQGAIKQWANSMEFFKKLVTQHLDNKLLMETTSLNFVTKEWCEKNKVAYPLEFIGSFKAQLEKAYETNARNLPISAEKKAKFIESTKSIIESTIKTYEVINNSETLGDDTDKWYVNGERMLQDKDAFSENPEIDHSYFHSVLASFLSEGIHDGIVSTFVFRTTKSFLLKEEDLFKAIDLLGANRHYVIIGFGLNIQELIDRLKVPNLTKDAYKECNVYLFKGSRIVDATLFILKRSDLPAISTNPLIEETITKYQLEKISDSINLYSSVIDMSKASKEIVDEFKNQDKSEDEIRKSALLTIGLSLEIAWKKNIEMIRLNQYSEYRQDGLPNSIDDIKPFSK